MKLNNYEKDEVGYYVIINDKKIYQAEEKTQADIDFNAKCNAWRQRNKNTP